MSEEFSDDFVIEEEDTANRSFLIAAGSLIGVFILLAACLLVYVLMQRGEVQDEVAQIEAQNATTQAQNALVTQTVEALETQQALAEIESERATAEAESLMATQTVEAMETMEALPTETPTPTEVVQQPTSTATNTPVPTLVLGGGGDGDGTGALVTPITPGAGETLPQTGISILGIAAVGLGLVAILIVARRLRTN
jgi:LPXTG-motif cell wall-anchored protein